MKLLILLLLISSSLKAATIEQISKAGQHEQLASYYASDKNRNYSRKDYILISHSLRKLGRYREDIGLNVRLVKKFYKGPHTKLINDIRQSNTVDPEEFPEAQKIIYWLILNDYSTILKGYDERSPALEKDYKHFQTFSKLLVDLEFRESKVDRLNNSVNNHLEYLTNKVYRFSSSLFFQYASWQRIAELTGGGAVNSLIVTNRGYCLGGDLGVENHRFHFYMDGCFLYGAGGIKNVETGFDYQQANVPAYGFKGGPGFSMIVSSSKSRVGIKVPFIYTVQKYTNPPAASGFTIEETNPFSFMTTLYSRFQFSKWYLQTEFGKYIQQEEIFWGVGFGRPF